MFRYCKVRLCLDTVKVEMTFSMMVRTVDTYLVGLQNPLFCRQASTCHTQRKKEQESCRKGEYILAVLAQSLFQYSYQDDYRMVQCALCMLMASSCSSQSVREQYTRTKSYFGQPFIFNMIHTFGGQLAMFGRAHSINTRQIAASMTQ